MQETPSQHPSGAHPSPEEIKTAIEASGYLLESRVEGVLRAERFFTIMNSLHHNRADETRSIEVDGEPRIGASITQTGNSGPPAPMQGFIQAFLFVECKNNEQPIAFFLRPQLIQNPPPDRAIFLGCPSHVLDVETRKQSPLQQILVAQEWHHYSQAREIATQFCTFDRQGKKGWKAEGNNRYWTSLTDLCVAALHQVESSDDRDIYIEPHYPILVVKGPLYAVHQRGGSAQVEQTSHVQLHHSVRVAAEIIPLK